MLVVVEVVLFAASLFSTLDSSAGLLEHISFLLLWMGGLLGSYRMLVVFLVPLWCAGAWGIIREIRKARGQGLPYQGIYRDRPVD